MALEVDGVNINAVEIDGQVLKTFEMDGVLLLAPPTITTQPVGATILDNQTRTISVVAQSLGKDIKYQWQRNGVNISGATGFSYTHPAMAAGTYTYRCIISNKMGSITSNNAVITVNVSWAATHTFSIRNGGGAIYGYYPAVPLGGLSPTTAYGAAVQWLTVQTSDNRCAFAISGNHSGKTFRIEFGSASVVLQGAGVYDPMFNATSLVVINATITNWVASRNNQNVAIRIV